jgi:hypothetical protein
MGKTLIVKGGLPDKAGSWLKSTPTAVLTTLLHSLPLVSTEFVEKRDLLANLGIIQEGSRDVEPAP